MRNMIILTTFVFLQFLGNVSPAFVDQNRISANQVIEPLPNPPLNNTFPI